MILEAPLVSLPPAPMLATDAVIQSPPPHLPTLSILIPCYGGPALPKLIRCINSILKTVDSSRTEILLQDDACPDYDLTQMWGFPPFKIERNPVNVGFAQTINNAATRAQGDYLLLLNQDVEALTPNWADAMLTMFTNPDVGIVGPKLLFPPTPAIPEGAIQSCGGLFDGGRGPYHRNLGWVGIHDRRVATTQKVSWITGAALMISRDDFWRAGGLDAATYTRGYFEDVDICMRVRFDLHKEIWYCGDATLTHDPGSTGGNPGDFMNNSRKFHQRWDDRIVPDSPIVFVNY